MIQKPKGTKDVLPEESFKWKYVENIAKYKAALETQKKHTDYKWQESENWSINEDDEE